MKGALEVGGDTMTTKGPLPHPFFQLSLSLNSGKEAIILRPQKPLTGFMGQTDRLTMNCKLPYEKRFSSSFCSLGFAVESPNSYIIDIENFKELKRKKS